MKHYAKIKYRIRRTDGKDTWYQQYQLPYEKGKTVLWALTKIKEEQDFTLHFPSACRHAICGSCAVQVNGNSFLSCKTSIDELLETFDTDTLVLEPLNNFNVIRDLVVDWAPKVKKKRLVRSWLIPTRQGNRDKGFQQTSEEFQKIASPTDCILCGICASECSQLCLNENFLDPFILNKAYRFAVDSRDAAPEEHIRPTLANDLWKCVHCMECVTKCPKGIELTDEIAYLRQQTIRLGETNNKGARHAMAFHDDVKNKGRLNEMTLPIKTEGVVSAVGKFPMAFRLVKSGKIKPFHFPKAVKGIESVRKIYIYAGKEREL